LGKASDGGSLVWKPCLVSGPGRVLGLVSGLGGSLVSALSRVSGRVSGVGGYSFSCMGGLPESLVGLLVFAMFCTLKDSLYKRY